MPDGCARRHAGPRVTDFAGVRVLVVEDEGAIAFLIEEILEDLGCEIVASVATIARAEEAVRSGAVEIVILDVNLSGETTFDLARDLCRRRIPFVFSTGYGNRGLAPDLQDQVVVTKPFTPFALQQAIKSVLAVED